MQIKVKISTNKLTKEKVKTNGSGGRRDPSIGQRNDDVWCTDAVSAVRDELLSPGD